MRRAPALLLLLAGCAAGPTYHAPALPIASAVPASNALTGAAPPDAWWRLYDDAGLDALVTQALTANTDLRVAEANLKRARVLLSEASVARLPSTNISAAGGYAGSSRTAISPAGESGFISLGGSVSYEVDLFGRVTSSIRAARADMEAQAAARDGVRIIVAAETARAYADGCTAANQLAVAAQTLALQSQTFDLIERQAQAGRGSPLDVERARAQLETIRASQPLFRAARANALLRLAVLTGQVPGTALPAAEACTLAPLLRQPLPVGDGAGLLARRPDVRQAERVLAASSARVGVATASLWPTITLGGQVTSSGVSVGDLGKRDGVSFSLGPLISWSFPNIFAARAQVAAAKAGSEAALASFDGTVLTALKESQTALNAYAGDLDRLAALQAARDHGAEAARIVRLRYQYGAENFLSVLDAERSLATSEAALAEARGILSGDQIAVFKALGGGWQKPPPR